MIGIAEADDDVCDLHPGVVDVVLDLDRRATEAQRAGQSVTERRVPQVTDVSSFVRVNRRVLDNCLSAACTKRSDLVAKWLVGSVLAMEALP